MIILNESHRLASANQLKISENTLYWKESIAGSADRHISTGRGTDQGLDMEEEHANGIVTRLVEHKEIGKRILRRQARVISVINGRQE